MVGRGLKCFIFLKVFITIFRLFYPIRVVFITYLKRFVDNGSYFGITTTCVHFHALIKVFFKKKLHNVRPVRKSQDDRPDLCLLLSITAKKKKNNVIYDQCLREK